MAGGREVSALGFGAVQSGREGRIALARLTCISADVCGVEGEHRTGWWLVVDDGMVVRLVRTA